MTSTNTTIQDTATNFTDLSGWDLEAFCIHPAAAGKLELHPAAGKVELDPAAAGKVELDAFTVSFFTILNK